MKRWNSEEIKILREKYPRQSSNIEELDRTKSAIYGKATRLGIKRSFGVEVTCKVCGKKEKVSRYKAKKYVACSKVCHNKWQEKRVKVICEVCGKEKYIIPSIAKDCHFCSPKCRGEARRKRIEVRCAWCGKRENVPLSKSKKYKFCSYECRRKYDSEAFYSEGNPNWQGGKSFEPYPPEFNKRLKEQIRKRDNYKCQWCSITQKEHIEKYNQRLPIHHIDGDKKNCKPENLVALCHSCNVKIEVMEERPQFN